MRINLTNWRPYGNNYCQRKFLLLPRWYRNERYQQSIRWLEYAVIRYQYKSGVYFDTWEEECFIDDPKVLAELTK
jgi:hypothetical protein